MKKQVSGQTHWKPKYETAEYETVPVALATAVALLFRFACRALALPQLIHRARLCSLCKTLTHTCWQK